MLTLTYPHDTWLHRRPAGGKMAALCGLTCLVFATPSLVALAVVALAVAGLYLTAGGAVAALGLRLLRPLIPFALVLVVWHGWLALQAEPGALTRLAQIGLRMGTAVAAANLVSLTTRLSDMRAVVERLARPLARFGLPPKVLGLAVALVIRFIPVMGQRHGQLSDAWRARSAKPARAHLVFPLVLAALDDAEQVAQALRARGGAG